MAGKTGTAQVVGIAQNEEYDEERGRAAPSGPRTLSSAFAPALRPRIAVAVVVENGGSGSTSAAPIARQVMDYYLAPESGPRDDRLMAEAGVRHSAFN